MCRATTTTPGTDHSIFDALHVDQVSVGGPYCFGENEGDSDLAPGEGGDRPGWIPLVPRPHRCCNLMLETDGPLFIEITPGV